LSSKVEKVADSMSWSNIFSNNKTKILRLNKLGELLMFDEKENFIRTIDIDFDTNVELLDLISFKIINNNKEFIFKIINDTKA